MTVTRQTRQPWWTKRGNALLIGMLFGPVLTLTGCSQAPTTAPVHDPLTGVRTPPGNLPAAPKTETSTSSNTSTTPQANNQTVPPIPDKLSASNLATTAGTTWGTPGSLAINGPVRLGTPGQLTNDRKTEQTHISPLPGANQTPRVEKVPDAKPSIAPTGAWQDPSSQSKAQTVNSAPSANTDAILAKLKARGVTLQRRDALPGGVWKFVFEVEGPGGGEREVTAPDLETAAQLMLNDLPAVKQ
jgi:hypothetical protein